MNDILPQDPIALLKAVSSLLPPEAQEMVRQALAAREARYVNRGVSVNDPSAIDDIDPTNQAMAILMHEHPGVLYNFGINGSTFGGFTASREKFVIVAKDLVEQRRREILTVIMHDLFGNRPATALAKDLEDYALIAGLGLFLFGRNKQHARPLSEKNAQKLVAYIEEVGNDSEMWTCEYWRIADLRARQVTHWLPRDESQP